MKDVEISLNSTHIKPNDSDTTAWKHWNHKVDKHHTVTPDHRYTDSIVEKSLDGKTW